MKGIIRIISILIFSVASLSAQVIDVTEYYSDQNILFPGFEKVGNDLDFPNYRISSLTEDQYGYLWIGTKDGGLIRYNGYEFESYKYNPSNPYTLTSNDVFFVFEDSRNILWVGTDNGLSYFHPLREQFISVSLYDSSEVLTVPRNLTCITEDKAGNLILGTNIGVFRVSNISADELIENQKPEINFRFLDLLVNQLVSKKVKQKNFGFLVKDIHLTENGRLWILSDRELGYMEYGQLSFINKSQSSIVHTSYYPITEIEDAHKISLGTDKSMYVNNDDSLLILGKESINKADTKRVTISSVRSKVYDESFQGKALWVGYYDEGIKLVYPEHDIVYPLAYENKQERGLFEYGISCFLKSRSGVIFIGTAWGGLFKYNPYSVVESFHPDLQSIHQNQTSNLRYVMEDNDGYIWVIAENIYRCDKNTGEVLMSFDDKFFGHEWSYTNKILESKSGDFWIGAESRGLTLVKISNDDYGTKASDWKMNSRKLVKDKTITAISESEDGSIIVGAVYTNHLQNTIVTELLIFSQKGNLIDTKRISGIDITNGNEIDVLIYQIYPADNGIIWLATGEGLIKIEPGEQLHTSYFIDSKNASNNRLLTLIPDPYIPKNCVWLGFANNGLYLFNIETETFINYSHEINTNHVASILSDENNNLWLGTDVGLTKILLDTITGHDSIFLDYTKQDGLITTDFTNYYGPNSIVTPSNKLIFTGSRGFQVINPSVIITEETSPGILLTDFTLNYMPADFGNQGSPLDKSISLTDHLTLPYDKNTLGFEMTAIDFTSPKSLNYSYRLTNYDDNWIETGNQRNIQYTKLPPGEYSLIIKVSSSDGLWSEENEVLTIIIRNPWWTTAYAYIFYGLIFIGGVMAVDRVQRSRHSMKLRMQLNQVEADKLREMDQIKSKFFANISHEFKTPLTLILNPVEEMLNKSYNSAVHDSLVMIKRNARRLQDYINEILELSKIDSQRLNLIIRELDIVKFLKYQIAVFDSLAQQKNISIKLESPVREMICFLDPDKIGNIMSNLLSNAVKFTPQGGKIEVVISGCVCTEHDHCTQKKGCLIISVKDSGIGIPENKIPYIFDRYYKTHENVNDYGTGLGLALVKELVTLHNGSINVVSQVNKYTMFQLHFPMGINHYRDEEVENITRYEIEEDYYPRRQSIDIEPEVVPEMPDESEKIVLVIEDNDDMRALINAGLKREFKVLMAKDGVEGINKALETCPDLIICDVMMPKKDGFEVARTLKLNELTSHVPIIILTAKSQVSDKITGLETGADDYLIKPFMPLELKARIKNLIEQREKLRGKYSKQGQLNIDNELIKPIDQVFIEKVIEIINLNLKDENFGVQTILDEMSISRTQLHRKLKALLNQSANELIQSIRLQKASDLLRKKAGTVSEICFEVGFNSPPTFTNLFKKHFGHTPTEHIEQ